MPGFAQQPYEVTSFKGGLTDQWNSAQKNQYMRADNFLLTKEENPFVRPGSALWNPLAPLLPSGVRVSHLINFKSDTNLLALSGANAYIHLGAWNNVATARGGSAAFPTAGASTRFQSTEWKNHLYVANDQGLPLEAMYFDDTANAWRARQMGLPPVPLTSNFDEAAMTTQLIAWAAAQLTHMQVHYANPSIDGLHAHLLADGNATPYVISLTAPTTLAQAITVIIAMQQAFMVHLGDAYHGLPIVHVHAGKIDAWAPDAWKLTLMLPATDLMTAMAALWELRVRWNAHIHDASLHTFDNVDDTANSPLGTDPALTAGPTVTRNITAICSLANAVKAQIYAHVMDGSPSDATKAHKLVASGGSIPSSHTEPDATDFASLCHLINVMMGDMAIHEMDAETAGAYTGLHRAATTTTNLPPYYTWDGTFAVNLSGLEILSLLDAQYSELKDCADHLRVLANLINAHDRDKTAHGTQYVKGTHALSATVPTVSDYLYGFHYDYSYTVNGVTFEIVGPVRTVLVRDTVDPSYQSIDWTHIPPLVNQAFNNYDLGGTKIKIFRTQANQVALSLVGTVPNTQATFSDLVADSALQTNTIYTSGGVPNADQPPAAKYIARVGNFLFFGNFVDTDGTDHSNRIVQASPDAPENAPGSFSEDLPLALAGMCGMKDEFLIAWTKSATYRITPGFDIQGKGSIVRSEISPDVGLAAGYSPVKTEDGVIFFGTDGIYFTNGYQLQRLSRHWTSSYLALVALQPDNIQGTFHRTEKRVYWGIQTPGDATDVNAVLALDLNHDPTTTENGVFTTWSNGSHFMPSALTVFGSQLIRGDSRGYVFKHDSQYTADPRVDGLTWPGDWYTVPILYDWISVGFNFDNPRSRKQVFRIYVEAKNLGTNLSLQINSNNDDGRQFASLTPIYFTGAPKLAGTDALRGVLQFGNYRPTAVRGQISEWRRFPGGHLRCSRKQIQFTNAFGIITQSDLVGEVSIALVAGVPTITLSSGNWPTDVVDQLLYVETDGYVQEYTILSQAGAVLTTDNPGSAMQAASNLRWKIMGYAKNQRFQMNHYVLTYAMIGTEHMDAQEGTGDLK